MKRHLNIVLAIAAAGLLAAAGAHLWADGNRTASSDGNRPVLRVVVLGDSLTGHRPHTAYQGKYLKYADLLELMLEARVGLGTVEVLNAGWAGDATYAKPGQGMPGAVGRLKKDVLALKPDVAVVLIGGNDKLATAADRARTQRNLDAIAGKITTAGIKLLMCQYPPSLPDPNAPQKAWDLTGANPLIAAAARGVKAPVADLGPSLVTAARKHGRGSVANPVDGVHLQPRGEIVFARTIFARLDKLGWIPRPRAAAKKEGSNE